MTDKWDGQKERRINHTDHDTLIELVQIIKNQSANDLIIAENLKAHEQKDENNFVMIRKDILGLQKIDWTATGIIIALDALPKIGEVLHLLK